jgi:hypothetical protein
MDKKEPLHARRQREAMQAIAAQAKKRREQQRWPDLS